MTEETKVETKVEEKPDVEVHVEPTPYEEQAREQGWVGKEEWAEQGRDVNEWRPAKEFVDRGELYKTLHSTRRDLKQTQHALTALQRHHQFVFERAHKQAIADLKKDRRMAFQEEDMGRVEAIESEIEELEDQHKKEVQAVVATQQQTQNTIPPEFTAWIDRNSWYLMDKDLQNEADSIGIVFMNKNPGSTPQIVLDHVGKETRKRHPEKFGQKKAALSAVASVNKTSSAAKKKSDDFELTDMEREMMNTFVRSKVMTEEQYISDLRKVRDMK